MATNARVTQEHIQVAVATTAVARVTQEHVQVAMAQSSQKARITQEHVQVIWSQADFPRLLPPVING